ncbi:hypothetical protein CY34DRAFT_805427 [Suillus luteus UH-Slu-Lm8-n1]|uniref:Uncharacterized protein n=1 Tax=Suillus luteus UH-Slu-Lm8-n1 TaxID=930992 RepID=A0A0D0AJJ1_9AGAM|nr:hypothetical protein CY34DRAFT_805427 [Suillus luteus UH-Slu-Lm8-n1]
MVLCPSAGQSQLGSSRQRTTEQSAARVDIWRQNHHISQFLVDPIMSKRATTSFPPGCNQTIAYSSFASNSSKGLSLNLHRPQNIWVTA